MAPPPEPVTIDLGAVSWVTGEVAITNYVSARNVSLLREHDIRAVLCLDRDVFAGELGYGDVKAVKLVHLNDGANELRLFEYAVRVLRRLVSEHKRVLVHCVAGRSRSASVVAGYLRVKCGLQPDEALAAVRRVRSVTVVPPLLQLLDMMDAP
jgi:dual specificity phosphatase 12